MFSWNPVNASQEAWKLMTNIIPIQCFNNRCLKPFLLSCLRTSSEWVECSLPNIPIFIPTRLLSLQTPNTAATTPRITRPCRCCWGNPSTWKCGCSMPPTPVWCCWCTSVWPTPSLERLCGCCSTMGTWFIYLFALVSNWLTDFRYNSQGVPTRMTPPWSRRCSRTPGHPLLQLRPAASPSAPSSSFRMVSSGTRTRRWGEKALEVNS